MPYRIYTQVNLAETSRDKDDYKYTELGYTETLPRAEEIANEYIQNRFFRKDQILHKGNGNEVLVAQDLCSWGATLIVQEINMS